MTLEQTAAAIGEWATAAEAYQLLTVDVPAAHWIEALTAARDGLGLAYFDWLSAVDELAEGFSVSAHLAAVGEPGTVRHLLVRTRVPRDKAVLPSAVDVYAGAAWHERETNEMFGIDFAGHPHLVTLLLPDGFEGNPLRKDFVLAARVAKAWPGAKEPGESEGEGPARRKMQPAGVPDPNEWGPLKGTLPPVAERPARGARAAGAARTPQAAAAGAAAGAAGAAAPGEGAGVRADRPRRTRSVGEGSVSQAPETPAGEPSTAAAPAPGEGAGVRADRPRRTRSVGEGSVSQAAETPAERPAAAPRTRSGDAPWHAPVPAYDPETGEPETGKPEGGTSEGRAPEAEPAAAPEPPAAPDAPDGDGADGSRDSSGEGSGEGSGPPPAERARKNDQDGDGA
ncbi:NADH-quinone oxidoreductase subunit C [Kitasatospora camelliae]|uniref:NADH-quinone oxidoreductase subunit C n=1 Tax=Kitasatospora camelliae TaxID=3156397 RepID=A0AAU8JV21_9ACTN